MKIFPYFKRYKEIAIMRTTLLMVALLTISLLQQLDTYAQQKKNILIILSDDQNYQTIKAWGNPEINTPNLDSLVRDGFSFRQAHVMGGHQGAICMPSRAMLLTGRYLNQIPDDGRVIPDSLSSLPEVLQAYGYNSFHTGKWHSDGISHDRLFNMGDCIFMGGMNHEKDGGQFNQLVHHYNGKGDYPKTAGWKSETYSSECYANAAISFLESDVSKEKPFLCYVAFTSPHDPRTPPNSFRGTHPAADISLPQNFLPEHPFDNGDLRVRDEMLLPTPREPDAIRKEIGLYYDMVSEMDAQVGRIIRTLEEQGLRENTIIVFASDNGLAIGQHGLLGKQNLYEHSIRVPLIFAGPNIPASTTSNAFCYLSDIAPTIFDLLAIPQPPTVEAKSLAPVLQNPKEQVRNNIYNVYGHWSRSIKSADGYKLIVYNVNGVQTTQLFDLNKDPLERTDLSNDPKQKQRLAALRHLLKNEMKTTHDDLDIDLPNWGRKADQKASGS